MSEPTREEIAWAAGLFEGEGCISNAGVNSVSLTLHSTDRDVLLRFRGIVGCGSLYSVARKGSPKHWKPIWEWQVTARGEVHRILALFLPWFQSRRSERAHQAVKRLEMNLGLNGDKTHCKHGHPLSGENLYVRQGKRGCITCRRRNRMVSYHRVRARKAHV